MHPTSSTSSRPAAGARGFSLIEVTIAFLLFGVVLLLGMAVQAETYAWQRRLDAHDEALAALEASVEGVRSGGLILDASGQIDADNLPVPPADERRSELLTVEVVETSLVPVGFRQATITVRYGVAGQPYERSVVTYLWTPP